MTAAFLQRLLLQTLDLVTQVRPRVLKIGSGLGLVDGQDGTATLTRSALSASDIASGTIATARLGSGVADATTFLRGDQSYATPAGGGGGAFCGASVYQSVNQTIANNTPTILNFDSEYYDTSAIHDPATNNSRLTVPSGKAGYWRVSGMVEWDANATGYRYCQVRLNAATGQDIVQAAAVLGGSDFTAVTFSFTWPGSLSVADYLELMVEQTSGGPLDANGNAHYDFFAMEYLGA